MNILSSLGLILDIIGVLLLFQYGLPSKIDIGDIRISEASSNEDKLRELSNRKIVFKAKIGLTLILLGFVLQLIGTNLDWFKNLLK